MNVERVACKLSARWLFSQPASFLFPFLELELKMASRVPRALMLQALAAVAAAAITAATATAATSATTVGSQIGFQAHSYNDMRSWKDAATSATTIGSQIGFQAHSYNDMRSWHQLFLKGATHVKIDPNYQDAAFCASQARDQARDKRGCFVLNHDTPTMHDRRLDYNTTSDLLALLADPANPLRKFFTRPHAKTFVALCFKTIPVDVCSNSTDALNWLGLVDDLVAAYLTLLSAHSDLNVEFVLDSGVPQACHVQRWRPLVSTAGDYPGAFHSNERERGYDRWQVLNGKWPPGEGGQFAMYAQAGWGKFVNASRAWQVWEPCDQKEFLAASQVYAAAGVDHPLKFAINVDVAMSEVYLSPATGRGINRVVAPGAASSSARLVAVGGGNKNDGDRSGGAGRALLLYTFLGADGKTTMYGATATDVAQQRPVTTMAERQQQALPGWTSSTPPTSLSAGATHLRNVLAAVNAEGELQLYSVGDDRPITTTTTTTLPALSPLGQPVHLAVPAGARHVAASVVVEPPPPSADDGASTTASVEIIQLYYTVTTMAGGGALYAQVWSVGNPSVHEASATSPPVRIASNMSASSLLGDVVAQRHGDRLTIVALYDQGVDAAVLRLSIIDWDFGAGSTPTTTPRVSGTGTIVGVGRAPTLSLRLSEDGTSSSVAAAFADSFCPNNEKQNKQTFPASCDQTPVSIPGVLGYAVGPLSAWRGLVEGNSTAGQRSTFSACSETLLHGAFSQGGGRPSVAMLNSDPPTLACLHDAYSGDDPHTCGAPIQHKSKEEESKEGAGGVLLDGWSFVMP